MDWKPIAGVPEAWKDGRQVLLGERCTDGSTWAVVAVWSSEYDNWVIGDENGMLTSGTHYCGLDEIEDTPGSSAMITADFVGSSKALEAINAALAERNAEAPSLSDKHRELLRSAANLMMQIGQGGLEGGRMTLEEMEYVTRPLGPSVT